MNTGGSCGSAGGTEQLAFIHGDVAVRRHVRLFENLINPVHVNCVP